MFKYLGIFSNGEHMFEIIVDYQSNPPWWILKQQIIDWFSENHPDTKYYFDVAGIRSILTITDKNVALQFRLCFG